MKTTDTALDHAVHAETFDDIIFDGRNLKYGAYSLRKTYSDRLGLSLLATLCAAALLSLLLIWYSHHRPVIPEVPDIPLPPIPVVQPGIIPVVPPPPVIDMPKEATNTAAANGPIVVVEEVKDPVQPATQEDLAKNNSGSASEGTGPLIVVNDKPGDEVDEDRGFYDFEVNEKPMFRGGSVDDFRAWLVGKIRYPEKAAFNEIKGTVYVKFAVGKDGKICDITVEKGIHPLIDQAVVNALLISPAWKPAKHNGRAVKVWYNVPVKFDLQR